MATATTDTEAVSPTTKADGGEKPSSRGRRSPSEASQENDGHVRYFLGRAGGDNGAPALDREVASEGEALVEALRLGVTYYAIEEFRVVPDFSGRRPQLNKESVQSK
ncbi:MAG TPA: hypothetical protein VN577_01625 [Terriglobales bacterium]|nr:hypothetical protein [Terriglobales bacterium]